ncbi:MAG: peptidylprolyl isomerase [Verrucomicrobia bacterium]|nr:peptidylprolyl isomerase [Verrucomicrobiota bacterium]
MQAASPRRFVRALGAFLVIATSAIPSFAAAPPTPAPANPATASLPDIRVVIHTDKGDIAATLFASKAPMTVANFVNLAKRGFYNNLTFHRVIPGFMAQGGDPQGTGTGNAGYRFEDEFRPELRFDKAGLLAMANSGPGTNSSQFFITHVPTPHLNDHHTIFGRVTKGQGDVVMSLKNGDHIKSIDVLDSTDALFAAEKEKLDSWNAILDRRAEQLKARSPAQPPTAPQ